MGLVLERVQRDPWEREAVRRLSLRDEDGAVYYEQIYGLQMWELQFACEFAFAVERCISWWERMTPGGEPLPRVNGGDRVAMRDLRRERVALLFTQAHFAVCTARTGARFVVGASDRLKLRRHVSSMRLVARHLDALEAFDEAIDCGGVWWVF
jgi:hypothetical protein